MERILWIISIVVHPRNVEQFRLYLLTLFLFLPFFYFPSLLDTKSVLSIASASYVTNYYYKLGSCISVSIGQNRNDASGSRRKQFNAAGFLSEPVEISDQPVVPPSLSSRFFPFFLASRQTQTYFFFQCHNMCERRSNTRREGEENKVFISGVIVTKPDTFRICCYNICFSYFFSCFRCVFVRASALFCCYFVKIAFFLCRSRSFIWTRWLTALEARIRTAPLVSYLATPEVWAYFVFKSFWDRFFPSFFDSFFL